VLLEPVSGSVLAAVSDPVTALRERQAAFEQQREPASIAKLLTTSASYRTLHDADALIRRAVAAGATVVRPPTDQFYGERSGTVRDPFGHEWNIGHEIEKLSAAEMQRRYDAMLKGA